MITPDNWALLDYLHDGHIIDKRYVLWWDLGYEGRKVIDEAEFNSGLGHTAYEVQKRNEDGIKIGEKELREYDFWVKDYIPIFPKDVELVDGVSVPCFITAKPMSDCTGGTGWDHLHNCEERKLPFYNYGGLYFAPHVRGIAIEKTDRFIFWHPLTFGVDDAGLMTYHKWLEKEGLLCMVNPVDPQKFLRKLVEQWDRGRRQNKKPEKIDCGSQGQKIVPYYEFNTKEPNIMIYPAPLLEGRLEMPVVVRSRPDEGKAEIMGTGYFYFLYKGEAAFWRLNDAKREIAKKALKERLGLDAE